MSFDNHDNCRRCGSPDGPSHTATECERIRSARVAAQRARDATPLRDPLAREDKCGHAGPCAWMRDMTSAIATPHACMCAFERREMEHPDTLATVTRYVLNSHVGTRIVRACPACGGNPNEQQVMR